MGEFYAQFGPVALIAGASEGLGAAFSTLLASYGLDLILVGRREKPLLDLSAHLSKTYGVKTHYLAVDLVADDAVTSLKRFMESNVRLKTKKHHFNFLKRGF